MEFKFKVDDKVSGEWAAYKGFIESLRNKLASSYSHNRPVLPPQQIHPVERFHVELQTQSRSITLRIRRGNLYLDGYKMWNADQWLELGRGPGPNFLGFNGDYNDLENAAGQAMDRINLGQPQLGTAVNQLASTTNRQERAKQLIVVIQMICESIRFSRISDHLAKHYYPGAPPPAWMIALVHGWGIFLMHYYAPTRIPPISFGSRNPMPCK
uniref:rRNA N-glycosylase n=1 Tax=Ananas comosus var. bracteatus TaxID=296719 RepID=A0A6V7QR24_ANACO